MELDQINALPNGAKERYMMLEKLYDHPGFKYVKEWANAQVKEAAQRLLTATTWEQHCLFKGAMDAYQNFVNLEDISENEFTAIANSIIESRQADLEDMEAEGE